MNTLVEITAGQRAQVGIKKGQWAWSQIKAPTVERRFLWLEVGVALMYGRLANPSNQAFGKWCAEAGFDMAVRVRSDAMWLSENSASVFQSLEDTTAAHPTAIRALYKDQQAILKNSDPVLKEGPVPTKRVSVVTAIGRRVAALYHRRTTTETRTL